MEETGHLEASFTDTDKGRWKEFRTVEEGNRERKTTVKCFKRIERSAKIDAPTINAHDDRNSNSACIFVHMVVFISGKY